MRVFIYAYEKTYLGTGGIHDEIVKEIEVPKDWNFADIDFFIFHEYIFPMSWNVIESYGTLRAPEEEEEDYDDLIEGYWKEIRNDVTLSIEELNKETKILNDGTFTTRYCK